MRGFFAFGLRSDFNKELGRAMASFPIDPNLKPLLPADYHVTIKFLSEFSSADFFACLEELALMGAPPAHSLRAGKIALWPTVLALECEPTPGLRDWHGRVNAFLERKGFLKERHPHFHPHITLARRVAGKEHPGVEYHLAEVERLFDGRNIPFEPPALWRSQPEETGRRHHPLLSVIYR